MRTDRRIKRVLVAPELLIGMQPGWTWGVASTDVPTTASVVRTYFDETYQAIAVVVRDDSFEEVPFGKEIAILSGPVFEKR